MYFKIVLAIPLLPKINQFIILLTIFQQKYIPVAIFLFIVPNLKVLYQYLHSIVNR